MRVLALAFVCAGAFGNLIDRLRSNLGVVDFLDVGFGDARWPTFNVADMAVSVGAVLLAYVLWQEDRASMSASATAPGAPLAGVAPGDHGDLV
jgi:signal peptidase II